MQEQNEGNVTFLLITIHKNGLEVEGNHIRITEERKSETHDSILERERLTGIFFQKL